MSSVIYIFPVSPVQGNAAKFATTTTSSTKLGSCEAGTLPVQSSSAYQLFAPFSLSSWYQLKSWSPVLVQLVFANLVMSVSFVYLFVAVSVMSSVSSTTTPVCQFTESTAHPQPHQVAVITGCFGLLSSTVIQLQATMLLIHTHPHTLVFHTGIFFIFSSIHSLISFKVSDNHVMSFISCLCFLSAFFSILRFIVKSSYVVIFFSASDTF